MEGLLLTHKRWLTSHMEVRRGQPWWERELLALSKQQLGCKADGFKLVLCFL
jgi:hypothetical protein